MRAHYFQHVPFEGLGSIALWLERAGYTVTSTPFFESDDLPDPGDLSVRIKPFNSEKGLWACNSTLKPQQRLQGKLSPIAVMN